MQKAKEDTRLCNDLKPKKKLKEKSPSGPSLSFLELFNR